LVKAGAPLDERLVTTLDDMVTWHPWTPSAFLALTGRQTEAYEVAAKFACTDLVEILGGP
jgi:hypothetical protein